MSANDPLLTLDCSSHWCALALRCDGEVYEFCEDLQRSHSQHLLSAIETLRQRAGVADEPLASLGVVVGPGSFTGVRIAVAAAQALAFAYGCPVARLDALQFQVESAVAAAMLPLEAAPSPLVVSARRSRAELYYVGAYAVTGQRSERQGALALVGSLLELEEWWRGLTLTSAHGNPAGSPVAAGVPWVGAVPAWLTATPLVVEPRPAILLLMTDRLARAGEMGGAADALPLYLQADSPWQPSKG